MGQNLSQCPPNIGTWQILCLNISPHIIHHLKQQTLAVQTHL